MEAQAIIFVVVVSLIILSIAFIYISVYLGALFHEDKTLFFIFSILYGIDLLLLIISYLRAVCASPGYTDPATKNKLTSEQIQLYRDNAERQNIRKKQRGKNRYGSDPTEISELKETAFCEKCDAVKPARAHHCKLCQRCILRMDHHCPWVGNCVGQHNNKYFILFLFYATLGLLFTWATLCVDSYQDWRYIKAVWVEEEIPYLMTIIIIFAILLSLSIGSLFVTQILGLIRNITTLESFIPNIEGNSPFDGGDWRMHFAEVFGNSSWLLPTAPDLQENYI